MDNQEKKRHLMRCISIRAQISDLEAERLHWRELGESITQTLSDMPRGGAVGDKVGRAAAQIKAVDERIAEKILELVQERMRIEGYIEAVEDETLRRILRLRYLRGMTWERIAIIMNFSYRHTVRLHGEALTAVNIPKDVPKCP